MHAVPHRNPVVVFRVMRARVFKLHFCYVLAAVAECGRASEKGESHYEFHNRRTVMVAERVRFNNADGLVSALAQSARCRDLDRNLARDRPVARVALGKSRLPGQGTAGRRCNTAPGFATDGARLLSAGVARPAQPARADLRMDFRLA